MKDRYPTPLLKRKIIQPVVVLVVLGAYGIGLFFSRERVIPVAVPVLFLCFAGMHIYEGVSKLRRAHGGKWYAQHNIMLSFSWLSASAIIPAMSLLLHTYAGAHTVMVRVFFGMTIAFFMYALFLYRRTLMHSARSPHE